MTLLLECREKIKKFYRLNSVVIIPVLKFLIAFISINGVNTMMGYMPKLDNIAIVLITSLACTFLPAGCLVFLCAAFSIGHMYALSLEVTLVGFVAYLLLFLILMRFAPRDSYVVILTPLLFALKIPYVIPISVGLLGGPLSAVSVFCGVLAFYILEMIVGVAPTIRAMGDESDLVEKLRFLLEKLTSDKSMLVIATCFALTVIVVYVIRRMSVEHAWTIAIAAGAMVNLIALLIGDFLYDIDLNLFSAILGSILAVLVAKVIEFFRFLVDYGRTEKVQFEDDEYYYYVKAIPKMNVAAATKTVKRINANTQSFTASYSDEEDSGEYETEDYEAVREKSSAAVRRQRSATGGTARDSYSQSRNSTPKRNSENASTGAAKDFGNTRVITTERTARPQENSQYRQGGSQGVTVRSDQMSDETQEYEELY